MCFLADSGQGCDSHHSRLEQQRTHWHPRIFRSGSNSNEQAFALFDEDGKGRICLRDLRKVSAELGETLCDEELQAMIDEFDDDHDGQISYDEFVTIMRSAAVDDDS